MSPLMGMKSWDEPLRYLFKERHSRGVDFWACSEMVVTLSKLEPEISNVFLDVIDGDKRYFSFTKEEVLKPYIFKIFMDLINEETLPQIIHLLNKNLSGKSEKEIQEFFVMSSDQFLRLKPEELSQLFEGVPQLQKAKDFFIQHQNDPIPQTVFNVWDSQDNMVNLIEKSLQSEAFFKKFSLRDMAVVKKLLNDFTRTKGIVLCVFDVCLLNNLNRHMTLFNVLEIENESFSEKAEEKWNQVIDFFCQAFGGEDFDKEASDIVKFAEKRKLEQMFPEENNARKTVKVKL